MTVIGQVKSPWFIKSILAGFLFLNLDFKKKFQVPESDRNYSLKIFTLSYTVHHKEKE